MLFFVFFVNILLKNTWKKNLSPNHAVLISSAYFEPPSLESFRRPVLVIVLFFPVLYDELLPLSGTLSSVVFLFFLRWDDEK